MATERPLLLLGMPTEAKRENAGRGAGTFRGPSVDRQGERLDPRFAALVAVLDRGTTILRGELAGVSPEHAIVLEIRDSVDKFQRAVEATQDVEWLAEFDLGSVATDDDFSVIDAKTKKAKPTIRAKLFLIMLDQAGVSQLIGLWKRWRAQPHAKFPHRLNAWKNVFKRLHDVRLWSVQDRLEETGVLEAWRNDLAAGLDSVHVEVELWWRNSDRHRETALRRIAELIMQTGGRTVGPPVTIASIHYCAVLASLPRGAIEEVLASFHAVDLMICDHVMFFRPRGQADLVAIDGEGNELALPEPAVEREAPLAALLDGLPVERHPALTPALRVDDPDGWGAEYPTAARMHGTAMASLIVHGDLQRPEPPLPSPLYVRPILRYDPRARRELFPDDRLVADVLHVAVRRMFEPPAARAPTVRVINLSIGDANRPFDGGSLSPCARLLDWLSFEYKVLLIVSAGNHAAPLELDCSRTVAPAELRTATFSACSKERRLRRILTPSEAINVVTVGALSMDGGPDSPSLAASIVEPMRRSAVPSPTSGFGLGHRRAVKPDVVLPGGRVPFRERYGTGYPGTVLEPAAGTLIPLGMAVASPGASGDRSAIAFSRGTSTAAALATRSVVRMLHMLEELRRDRHEEAPQPSFDAILAKALLVHSCSWEHLDSAWQDFVGRTEDPKRRRDEIARAIGYGAPVVERVLGCTAERATAFATGNLSDGNGLVFALPLPNDLSGSQARWRLTTTLSWFSPIKPATQRYRAAALWTSVDPTERLRVAFESADVHRSTAKRGTAEHIVYVNSGAAVFARNSALEIKVNCRGDADPRPEDVPFALVVSLETAPGVGISVYETVRDRLRERARARARS